MKNEAFKTLFEKDISILQDIKTPFFKSKSKFGKVKFKAIFFMQRFCGYDIASTHGKINGYIIK